MSIERLAALLFPAFANARERARQARCLNNLKQLGIAFQQYMDDNSGRMPSVSIHGDWFDSKNIDWCGTESIGGPLYVERGSLWRYARARAVYLCPTDAGLPARSVSIPTNRWRDFGVDSKGSPRGYPLSYALNGELHYRNISAESRTRLSRLLELIQEERDTINDGLFLWRVPGTQMLNNHDTPDSVHYDGTTDCLPTATRAGRMWTNSSGRCTTASGAWTPGGRGTDIGLQSSPATSIVFSLL